MKDFVNHPLEKFVYCPKCSSTDFVVNNEKSKKCLSCGFIYYFNSSAATVGVILNENNQILVCRRANEPAKGSLDLPGGFIDMYETAEEGIKREIDEELGIAISEPNYIFSIPNIYVYSDFTVHTLDLFFLCRIDSGQKPLAKDDVKESFFVDIEMLKSEDFGLPSISKAIEKLKQEKDKYIR